MSERRMGRRALRRVPLFLLKTLGLALGLLAVVGTTLALAGSEKRKEWIEGAVGRASGLELSVTGELDLSFGGGLHLRAEGVELANPEWVGSEPGSTLFSADTIDLDLSLRDLLSRRLRFDLDLVGASVLLERDAQGRSNWSTRSLDRDPEQVKSDREPEGEGGFLRSLSPSRVGVTDATVVSRQPDGEETVVEIRTLNFGVQEGGLAFVLDADYDGLPLSALGESGSLKALRAGSTNRLSVQLTLGSSSQPQIDFSATGTVGGMGPGQVLEVASEWQLNAPSVGVLAPFVPLWVANLGRVEASGRLEGHDGLLVLEDVSVAVEADVVEATIRGSIANLTRALGIEAAVDIRTESTIDFMGGFGLFLPAGFPSAAEASGTLSGSGRVLQLADAVVELTGDGVRATARGSMEDLTRGDGIDASIEVASPDLATLSTLFDTELPGLGEIEAKGRLLGTGENMRLENVEVTLVGPDVDASAEGRIERLESWDGFDLAVRAETMSLESLLDRLGVEPDRPLPQQAQARGRLRGSAAALRLEDASATIDAEDISVEMDGSILDIGALAGLELAVVASVGDLASVSEFVGAELPQLGPVVASAIVRSLDDGNFSLEEIDARLSDPLLEAHASGSIASLSASGGLDLSVDLESSQLMETAGRLGLDIEKTIAGTLTASGRVTGDFENLAAEDVQAHLADEGLEVRFAGAIEELRTGQGIAAQVEVEADALSRLSGFVGRDLPKLGALDAKAHLERSEGSWNLEELDAKLERSELSVEVKGSVTGLPSLHQLDLDLVLEVPSLKQAMDLVDPDSDVNPGGGLAAEVTLQRDDGGFRFDPVELRFGKTSLKGDVTFRPVTDESPSRLRADLHSALLSSADIRHLLTGGANVVRQGRESQPPDESGGKIFSSAELPFDVLRDLDAQIDVRADELELFGSMRGRTDIRVEAGGGRLSAKYSSRKLDHQPTRTSIEIDATAEPPQITLELDSASVDPNLVFPPSWITGGRMAIEASFDTRGSSVSTLMANLDGSAVVDIRGAETRHKELGQFGESVIQQIDPFFEQGELTPLRCIATELEAADGLVRFTKGPIIVTDRVAWFVHAEVDLREERMEIHGRPRARKGFGVGKGMLSGLVEISGPLSEPDLKIDPTGVASGVTSVLKTVFARGASLLKGGWHDLEVCRKIGDSLDDDPRSKKR